MSNIDKQVLREAAEKALPAMQRLLMMPNDELFDEALLNVDGDVNAANVFNLLAGPETILSLLDELEVQNLTAAATDVLAERHRQKAIEGWTPEHDDEHCNGELAIAASCYAIMGAREQCLSDGEYQQSQKALPYTWPWDPAWWKPKGVRSDLVRAGALVLAEIERIDRQEVAQ
ncbi:TPA: ead/Ea22-like family protein [Klebsiella oxytoca]|uniref:Ead/Ea22-like family protein n=1 Tax=Klebsiella oxytoca TaxID=571 RepID=A0AAN5LAU7_KLEOX|nr:ead/Ea22-like family protein [Klebsiella oxytoca]